jgi:hypothetical protein
MDTLHDDQHTFLIISRSIRFSMRKFSEKKLEEKIKTHILCSVTFLRKSLRLLDNAEIYGTARQALTI